jgi:hypothetical protein
MPAQDRKRTVAKLKKPMAKAEALQKKLVSSGKDLKSLLKSARALSKQ